MLLHLKNDAAEDIVAINKPYNIHRKDLEHAHGTKRAWAPIAKDANALLGAFRRHYMFSEDILPALEEQIGVCADDVNKTTDEIPPGSAMDIVLRFTSPGGGRPFITEGAPVLERNSGANLAINVENIVSFVNRGGISKGLRVMITGPAVSSGAVSIDEITLDRAADPNEEIYAPGNRLRISAPAQMKRNSSGKPFVIATFPDFEIPEGVNKNCKQLRGLKRFHAEFAHEVIVRFTPKGPGGSYTFEPFGPCQAPFRCLL